MDDLGLLVVGLVAAAIPVAITATHWLGWGTYGWFPHMDTLAHFGAGVAIGSGAQLLVGVAWVTVATGLTLALVWEFVEPRMAWVSHVGRQDTEADIAIVAWAATLVALATCG